jgi:tRNA-uridine 2-sulfurtransferase
MLLKVGRHLRPRAHFKLIVGRDEGENNFLSGYRRQYSHLSPTSHKGALVLLTGEANSDDLHLAARLTARFSQGRNAAAVSIAVCDINGCQQVLTVRPLAANEIPPHWYL